MKPTKKKKTAPVKKDNSHFKYSVGTITYEWKPPTPEEIAKQKEVDRKNVIVQLKEIAIYLEGVMHTPTSGLHRAINRQHLNTLWTVIDKNSQSK